MPVSVVSPNEIRVLRSHSLGVVVGEERCVLVPGASAAFEPGREFGMQERSLAPRQRAIGDLLRERMLEDVLALALQRRARAPADEVPLLEHTKVELDPA